MAIILYAILVYFVACDISAVNAACNGVTDCAAEALMQFYDPNTGLWKTTGWWNSANALTAIIDFSHRTGSKTYRHAIATTFDKNNKDHFCNDYMDDSGWWGLAWIAAYDLTGETRYLNAAQYIGDYLYSFHDNHCGNGVWWRNKKDYKNAITNELFIKLTAALHNRIHGDTKYLSHAVEVWDWFEKSGMINAEHLINDGLDKDCHNNKQETWSYNQGVILGGLVELSKAKSNSSYLDVARKIADAATHSTHLNPNGILRESCEGGDCGGDGPSFKGIFVRNLGELDRALQGRPYLAYLKKNADSAIKNKNALNQYGVHFSGPFDKADAARQHSVLDLLVSALD